MIHVDQQENRVNNTEENFGTQLERLQYVTWRLLNTNWAAMYLTHKDPSYLQIMSVTQAADIMEYLMLRYPVRLRGTRVLTQLAIEEGLIDKKQSNYILFIVQQMRAMRKNITSKNGSVARIIWQDVSGEPDVDMCLTYPSYSLEEILEDIVETAGFRYSPAKDAYTFYCPCENDNGLYWGLQMRIIRTKTAGLARLDIIVGSFDLKGTDKFTPVTSLYHAEIIQYHEEDQLSLRDPPYCISTDVIRTNEVTNATAQFQGGSYIMHNFSIDQTTVPRNSDGQVVIRLPDQSVFSEEPLNRRIRVYLNECSRAIFQRCTLNFAHELPQEPLYDLTPENTAEHLGDKGFFG